MAQITSTTLEEVRKIVYDFFSEECEVPRSQLSDATIIIKDIEGDSLMYLELLELFKKNTASR